MALWELFAPRRSLAMGRGVRWLSNLGLVVIDTLLLRVTFPIVAVGMAMFAEQWGWGFFNRVDVPYWAAALLSFIALDFVIYLQHVMFHAVPIFWRLHMVHHADLDFDVTTGLRFHPIEILLSMGIKLAAIIVLGPPAIAVLLFEVILNATSMFNHSNVRIPSPIDRMLRWLVVTPDMHRVHHSIAVNESNSNFGFNLPWWDRICGTYTAQPAEGHEGMTIGLAQFRDASIQRLHRLLLLPFAGKTGEYPINRRMSK
jgi:sterol desaturase/sphingolipid hydroxylase (fatty acid hydroxylase superfamily)